MNKKEYTIYKSSRKDRVECDVFEGNTCLLSVYLEKGKSTPAYIHSTNIDLISHYDLEQTLIPGVTKRVIEYQKHDIIFGEIFWNSDESYSVYYPNDEVINIERMDNETFCFRKEDVTLAMISKYKYNQDLLKKDYEYKPIYTVECMADISDQCLITIFSFPILYFGF
ncbi:MAG: hypothetical protein IJ875_06290 [Solobacterium sp.]|nr:hypothetical protein [Solobacterium sp.]